MGSYHFNVMQVRHAEAAASAALASKQAEEARAMAEVLEKERAELEARLAAERVASAAASGECLHRSVRKYVRVCLVVLLQLETPAKVSS